ncbi:MAG: MtrB/PioB family outer membrane beta-barrel protein, partial [Gammaproteobacteria bacterium]|nr:MtrB/PioB family outer membrane beta-barrel protein [Gammaproteobacteria bacterium]
MKRILHFSIAVMALAVFSIHEPAAMAEDAPASDNDELNQYISFKNSISLGIGNWSDTRWHEGIFDGMRDDDTGTWTKLKVRNLGMDNVEVDGAYERQGDWGVDLSFSRIPRNNQYTVNTGLQGIGSRTQTITPTAAPGAGSDYKLEMRRDATSVTLFKRYREDMEFRIRFKNEEKSGNRQWGVRQYPTFGSTGGSYPAFVAEPIAVVPLPQYCFCTSCRKNASPTRQLFLLPGPSCVHNLALLPYGTQNK